MAENADGSVVIKIDLSSDDAEKELNRLKKKLLSLEEDLTVGKNQKDVLTQRLESYRKALELAQQKVKFNDGKFITSPENAKLIGDLQAKIADTEKAIEKQNAALESTQMAIDGVKMRYAEVKQIADQARAAAEAQAAAEAAQNIEEVNQSLSRTQQTLSVIKELFSNAFDFSNAKSDIKTLLHYTGSIIGKFAMFSAKLTFGAAKIGVS